MKDDGTEFYCADCHHPADVIEGLVCPICGSDEIIAVHTRPQVYEIAPDSAATSTERKQE